MSEDVPEDTSLDVPEEDVPEDTPLSDTMLAKCFFKNIAPSGFKLYSDLPFTVLSEMLMSQWRHFRMNVSPEDVDHYTPDMRTAANEVFLNFPGVYDFLEPLFFRIFNGTGNEAVGLVMGVNTCVIIRNFRHNFRILCFKVPTEVCPGVSILVSSGI